MIYFDNAATTMTKPKSVYSAAADSIKNHGNPGRGGYLPSLSAANSVFSARLSAASFFGTASPERVIFTQSATSALNIAVKCFARESERILISDLEHNSVRRPVHKLKSEGGLYAIFETGLFDDAVTVESVRRNMTADTGMIIFTHVSNVCGKILPVRAITQAAREINPNVITVLDAAQSAGALEINMKKDGIDILCVPAHKGLLGIMGLGMIVFADETDIKSAETFIEGGTGISSLDSEMPADLPEKFEAGTQNMPGIAALRASLEYLGAVGTDRILETENSLRDRLYEILSEIKNVTVYGGHSGEGYTGPLLFNVNRKRSDEVANFLEKRGIYVRSGYHCSPLAHKKLDSLDGGGVRLSLNLFNRKKEIEIFRKALLEFINL